MLELQDKEIDTEVKVESDADRIALSDWEWP